MMNQNGKRETWNIGSIALEDITFIEDSIEICIDISDMSEELKAEINKAIIAEKENYLERRKEFYQEYYPDSEFKEMEWCNKPVVIEFHYLSVSLKRGKAISYMIHTKFHDAENKFLEACTDTSVDLSAYEDELKKMILKHLIDTFF